MNEADTDALIATLRTESRYWIDKGKHDALATGLAHAASVLAAQQKRIAELTQEMAEQDVHTKQLAKSRLEWMSRANANDDAEDERKKAEARAAKLGADVRRLRESAKILRDRYVWKIGTDAATDDLGSAIDAARAALSKVERDDAVSALIATAWRAKIADGREWYYYAHEPHPSSDTHSVEPLYSAAALAEQQKRIEELDSWTHDLQSGMYVNCVYCGHRYGPADKVPATMADALKEHIEACQKHPMSALKLRAEAAEARVAELESEQDGLRLDAERYRLIRGQSGFSIEILEPDDENGDISEGYGTWVGGYSEEELDAAIDAARVALDEGEK